MKKLINGQYVRVLSEKEIRKKDIEAALSRLDPKDDAHWTKIDKKPDLRVVAEYTGFRVTRSEIDVIAPNLRGIIIGE